MAQINPHEKNKQATNQSPVVYNLPFDSRQQFYKFLGTVISFVSAENFSEKKEDEFICTFEIPAFHEEDFLLCVLEFHEKENYMYKPLGYLKTDDGRKAYIESIHKVVDDVPAIEEEEEEATDEFFTINEAKNDDAYDFRKESL